MIKDPSIVSRKQKLNNFLCNKRILKKKIERKFNETMPFIFAKNFGEN